MELKAAPSAAARSELKVLVLDDEPFMLKLIARMLNIQGFEHVTTCLSARVALECAGDATDPIDLIIFDLNMPEMDGIEFVRGLVERHYAGRLILVSGADDRVLRAAQKLVEAHAINVLGYLRKPVFSEGLAALLQKWSRPSGQGRALAAPRDPDELRAAIANGELVNHYQPKVDLATGQVAGVETLVRWNHPRDGLVMPDQFIKLAEENDFIDELTRAVSLAALRQARTWADAGFNLQVAINVSMDNLNRLDFPDFFAEQSASLGVAPGAVVIEVTESRLMQDPRAPLEVLTRLRLKGFLLSIDDFGTGHSSLVQLQNLPFGELKVDRGFVHHAWLDATTLAIYQASLALATRLNMEIVAEGVEDQADWDFLRRTRCGLAQGYFIGRPMPAEAIVPWIASWKKRCDEHLYAVADVNLGNAAPIEHAPAALAHAEAELSGLQAFARAERDSPAQPVTDPALACLARPIIDALPQRLCILDETGRILTVNAAWREFGDLNRADPLNVGVGANYLEICDRATGDSATSARECAAGIRSVVRRVRENFVLEYHRQSDEENRWCLCDVRRLADANGARILVSHSDITERIFAQLSYLSSERRFRDLSDLSADAYWETDEEHRFTLTSWRDDNPDRVEHSEWILAGILGKARWEVPYLEAAPEQWQQHRSDLERRRTFRNFEIKRTHEDSETRYFSVAGQPVFDSAGHFRGYRGVSRDITERRQAQARIEYLNRVYSVLSGINSLIVRASDRDMLFQEACRVAVENGGFKMAVLGIVDRKSMHIDLVASEGADAEHLAELSSRMSMSDDAPLGHNPAVLAVKQKAAVVINDSIGDARVLLKGAHRLRGIRSMVSLPIMVGEDVVGIFNLYAAEQDFFDDAEMRLLRELAGDVAFAIENLAKRQRLDYFKRVTDFVSGINALIIRVRNRGELFREACEVAVHKGGFQMAMLGVLDAGGTELLLEGLAGRIEGALEFTRKVLSSGSILPNPMAAQAIREKLPVISNDSQNDPRVVYRDKHVEFAVRSLVIWPLIVADSVIGVLALYARERNFFHDEEVKLLREVIGNIEFAIDHIEKSGRLDYLTYYDVLTGLANRGLFLERLEQNMRDAARHSQKIALFLLDLDHFKNLNDSLGRSVGDAILKHVADWLTEYSGDANLVARVAGDQFGLIVPEILDGEDLGLRIDKMLSGLDEHPFRASGAEYRIAAKVGAATFPLDAARADALLQDAEAALKVAKKTGDRASFYSPKISEGARHKITLENQLRRAMDKEEFVLFYQPKIDARSGALVGAEALIRWNNPEIGLVAPSQFIGVLEETGLIDNVGRWVIAKAISDHLRWRNAGHPAVRIAVNVSMRQLRNRAFVDEIKRAISVDVDASSAIELEITESMVMSDIDTNIANLEKIRSMEVTIALDDFGTGFSSLSYLSRLPLDFLKIDRSFVVAMVDRPAGLALVSAVITLSHALKLKVVAEGVETEEQSRLLRLLGCDILQGYLHGRPVPFDVFERTYLNPGTKKAA